MNNYIAPVLQDEGGYSYVYGPAEQVDVSTLPISPVHKAIVDDAGVFKIDGHFFLGEVSLGEGCGSDYLYVDKNGEYSIGDKVTVIPFEVPATAEEAAVAMSKLDNEMDRLFAVADEDGNGCFWCCGGGDEWLRSIQAQQKVIQDHYPALRRVG